MTTGSCLCGDLHYTCDETQAVTALHCHCRDCQRVTGSGKATVAMFPENAVQVEGTIKKFQSLGTDGSHVARGFCPRCGSQLFTFVEEIPGMVFIKAGSLDDSHWLSVDLNCWESSASPWLPPDASVPGVAKNPALND